MDKLKHIHQAIDLAESQLLTLKGIHKAITDSEKENQRLNKIIENLLDHCKANECTTCGEIVCPSEDPLHFHHDGCPSCS